MVIRLFLIPIRGAYIINNKTKKQKTKYFSHYCKLGESFVSSTLSNKFSLWFCEHGGYQLVFGIISRVIKFCSVCIFFEGSVFTFQFLNDKVHNNVKKNYIPNCEFYHSKIEK